MSIASYIKEIGRGKAGARSLSRAQAADLMGQLLDGVTTDLEVGAFCLAMRVKGESTDEMLGFLDAVHLRLPAELAVLGPCVVLPSYNGARKLPVLTPLLAALLARHGLRVLLHGPERDATRTTSAQVWQALGWPFSVATDFIATNVVDTWTPSVFFIKIDDLSPALARLLAVRAVVGVRNSAHSLVKLMNPVGHVGAVVVGSYTHPEYLQLMGEVFLRTPYRALLLRGTEGEPVADARRCPQMDGFANGQRQTLCEAQGGSLASLPELATGTQAQAIAEYTQAVLDGRLPVPAPITAQVQAICRIAATDWGNADWNGANTS